jgi:hypothetical protein
MARIIWIYGLISGSIIIASIVIGIMLGTDSANGGEAIGYLIMLIALSVIFVGIKRHRDRELGGVIRFRTALVMGIGIAGVASLAYTLGWEAYLAATDYRFIGEYTDSQIAKKIAAGASAAELAKLQVDIAWMKDVYAHPIKRMAMTAVEIAPVGLTVALISASLLCFERILPARKP